LSRRPRVLYRSFWDICVDETLQVYKDVIMFMVVEETLRIIQAPLRVMVVEENLEV